MTTREHPITKKVSKDAVMWAKGYLSHAEFCRRHNVGPQTAYRMLASSLAQHLNKDE